MSIVLKTCCLVQLVCKIYSLEPWVTKQRNEWALVTIQLQWNVSAVCRLKTSSWLQNKFSTIDPHLIRSTRQNKFPAVTVLPLNKMCNFCCRTFTQLNMQQCVQEELREQLRQNTPLASFDLSPVWDLWTCTSDGTLKRFCETSCRLRVSACFLQRKCNGGRQREK